MNELDLTNYVLNNITFIARAMEEQETTLQFSRDGEVCHMYVADSTMLTKVKKLIEKAPHNYKVTRIDKTSDGEVTGVCVDFPKALLSFRTDVYHREYSDERRAELVERAKNLSASRTKSTANK